MKLEQKGEKWPFLVGTDIERERERETEREKRGRDEREAPLYLYDLRSSGGCLASGQDLNLEYSLRATCGHQNQEFSSKIRAESSGGSGFRAFGSLKSFVFTQ